MSTAEMLNGSAEIAVANDVGAKLRIPAQPEIAKDGGWVQVECTITGITPMLQNAMTMEGLLNIYNPTKQGKSAAKPEPIEAARGKLHTLEDGRPCITPEMLYAAFREAGKYVRLDGRKMVTTSEETRLPALMVLLSTEIPIYYPGTTEPANWCTDLQRGGGSNGSAVCVIRPRFDKWEVRFEIEINRQEASIELIRDLIEKAGRRSGLGDFRPNCKGTYGQFCITRWDVKR